MVHASTKEMKKLPAVFYRTDRGTEPVRDWLNGKDFNDTDRRLIGNDIRKVEFGWPIGMPTCEPLGNGLFEVRTNLPGNRITRVFFCIEDGKMVLLHGFIKKSKTGIQTSDHDTGIAQERRSDLKRRASIHARSS